MAVVRSLEDRISSVGLSAESLKNAVSGPYVTPLKVSRAVEERKLDFLEVLNNKTTDAGINFQDPSFLLYSLPPVFSREQAMEIFYGILSIKKERRPQIKEILNQLTDFEKVYFFAGVWCRRSEKKPDSTNQLPLLVSNYILAGANHLWAMYRNKDDLNGGVKPDLPEYDQIKKENTTLALVEREQQHYRRPVRERWWDI